MRPGGRYCWQAGTALLQRPGLLAVSQSHRRAGGVTRWCGVAHRMRPYLAATHHRPPTRHACALPSSPPALLPVHSLNPHPPPPPCRATATPLAPSSCCCACWAPGSDCRWAHGRGHVGALQSHHGPIHQKVGRQMAWAPACRPQSYEWGEREHGRGVLAAWSAMVGPLTSCACAWPCVYLPAPPLHDPNPQPHPPALATSHYGQPHTKNTTSTRSPALFCPAPMRSARCTRCWSLQMLASSTTCCAL